MNAALQSNKNATRTRPRFAKTDRRYWRERVKKGVGKNFYSAEIQHCSERHSLALGTANRDEAAGNALKLFLKIKSEGWRSVLNEYRPAPPKKFATIGAYIEEAESLARLEPRTLNEYTKALRRLASGVMGINGKGRFDSKGGRSQEWRTKVDAISLDSLSTERVQRWMNARVTKAGDDQVAQRKAKNTLNTVLRNARALFGKKLYPFISERLILPDDPPLSEVRMYPRQSMRYISKIEAPAILKRAQAELDAPPQKGETPAETASRREQFKILVLACCAGLRFNEIDKLLWSQIDLKNGIIRIEATPYFRPKTEEAAGEVPIDDGIVALLEEWRANRGSEFVIKAAPLKSRKEYRSEKHHKRLLKWLRNLEFEGEKPLAKVQKPLHELRKEAGSLINKDHGLYAASRFLRHSNTQITAEHYVDHKLRVSTGLGAFLDCENVPDP